MLIIAYFAMPIKFIKIRTFKTTLLALKSIHSYIKMTWSIWRHVADEKLVSILRKEYGYIVEKGYLLGQSELISNKQKMNNCLIYSHEYLLNIQLVWKMERTLYDLQKGRRITDCKSPETYILNNQFMTHKKMENLGQTLIG